MTKGQLRLAFASRGMPGLKKVGGAHRVSKSRESKDQRRSEVLSWLGLAVGLWGLTAALLALSLALRHSVAALPLQIGAVASAFGGTSILVVQAIGAWRSASARMELWRAYDYKQRVGDLRNLEEVIWWGKRAIGEAHPDADAVMQLVAENPDILRVCGRERADGRFRFCGYVLLYPLKASAGEAIMSGEIRRGTEIGAGALCRSFADAEYLYVGMILGTDRHARSHVKDKLRAELIGILGSRKVKRVFARPGTEEGLKLMQDYGFLPISDKLDVWSTTGSELRRRLLLEDMLSRVVLAKPEAKSSPRSSSDPL